MNLLFVHQNFPGQYKHIAPALARMGHRVVALGMNGQAVLPGGQVLSYALSRGGAPQTHVLASEFEAKTLRAEAVARAAAELKSQGFAPDVICVHSGWGESLFLKDVWPQAAMLSFLEYFYRYRGADVNFDPEFQDDSLDAAARVRVKNANLMLALDAMDCGLSPTRWQRDGFPEWSHPRIEVIHDGVDTALARPNPQAVLESEGDGQAYRAGDEIITFVSRNLEPYRGFHVFMRSLPRILERRPKARVLILGGEEKGYGPLRADGKSWRQSLLEEVGPQLDPARVKFLGQVPYAVYLGILQVSAVHVYFTYPFVLSWSMLEAMSSGCLVVGSRTPPVEEVIRHGDNGLLVDFFDVNALADTVAQALARPGEFADVRTRARQTIVDRYDLHNICLPRHIGLIERLAKGQTL
ncbi:MAG: glycosyltransferase family 4 protein [Burkholderiaceae bacterium]|nr:glycosyltransferase family 4 protein [Burkholderiaceae bacterium]MDO9089001.1 glycosyltransferase family 4 protein [Burkholderiaceae bacterium]